MVPGLTRAYYSGSAVMRSILASIGSQKKKLQEICDSTGLTPSAAGSLLSSLSSHGLVHRIIPVTEAAAHYMRFRMEFSVSGMTLSIPISQKLKRGTARKFLINMYFLPWISA